MNLSNILNYGKWPLRVASAVIVLILTGYIQYAQWILFNDTLSGEETTYLWGVLQVQKENTKLSNAMASALLSNGGQSEMAELNNRYNIYVSQLENATRFRRSDPFKEQIDSMAEYNNIISKLLAFKNETDQYFINEDVAPAFDYKTILRLRNDTIKAEFLNQDLALLVNQVVKAVTVQRLEKLRYYSYIFVLLYIGLLGYSLYVFFYIRHQLTLAHRRNMQLEMLGAELVNAVDQAKAANAAKGDFLASMSHEIRTPITSIIGIAYLMQQSDPDGKLKNYVLKLSRSASGLLAVVNDILDFSKIEAGKVEIENTPFSLAELVDGLNEMVIDQIADKGLQFTKAPSLAIPDILVGDPTRLSQILLNLISNAIKFTSQGSISLSMDCTEPLEGTTLLHCCVADTGVGISDADQAKLFQAFSQADKSIARRFGGTGLGLAICHRLVHLMGGEIWVESKLGKGSNFHIKIPLRIGSVIAVHDAVPRTADLSGLSVLLIEDNEMNRAVTFDILTKAGAIVRSAEDGRSGLAMLESGTFDVVVTDIHMPGMGGFETAEKIRGNSRFSKLPIIAMSADITIDMHIQGKKCGISDLILKPIQPARLINAVSFVVNQ